MADDSSNLPRPFDVRTIRYLVRLMSRNELSEIDLQEGEQRIRLRRGPRGKVVTTLPTPTPPLLASPVAPPPTAPMPAPAAEAAKPAKKLSEIKSPTPGTFYASPSPGADPFVRAGSRVTPSTVICLIEAMKIFNEITADCTGVVAEILVENQSAVEYGQVLFRVDPTG